MSINYTSDQPCAEAFKALYNTTGWGPISRKTAFYQDSLNGSWRSRSAYFGGQLVGFVRVISDGCLHAFFNTRGRKQTYKAARDKMANVLLAGLPPRLK